MVQQRYEDSSMNCQKYFYALAAYVEVRKIYFSSPPKSYFSYNSQYFMQYILLILQISKDKTIIVRVSADINDHNPSNEKYKNEIVKSASLFKTEIDSEDDIRKGELKKMFVNIAGYLIENKGDCVNITYVESVINIHILIT